MSTAPSLSSTMDLATADTIVDRLSDALQAERRINGRYIALEWVGPWSLSEVIRSLFLILAARYRDEFPMSRSSADFESFTQLVGGSIGLVQSQVMPMAVLAPLDRVAKDSPEGWAASEAVMAQVIAQCQLPIEHAEHFAAWLKGVDPTFDDFVPMVNDHIDRHSPLD